MVVKIVENYKKKKFEVNNMKDAKKIAFCEECRKDVEYTVSDVPMTGKIKDVGYHYMGKEARCVNCHDRLYIPEINDYNLDALYKARNSKNKK